MAAAMSATTGPEAGVGLYGFVRTLGRGNYAVVRLAIHAVTKQQVAIKVIDKNRLPATQLTRLQREVRIMSQLDHPYIVKLLEVIESRSKMHLVLEYAPGGELYDVICRRRLPEAEARLVFLQLMSALMWCHAHCVVHRDLKSENILLDARGNVKLAASHQPDFGLSNVFEQDKLMQTFCGSPFYAAPELLRGVQYHGPEVDVWSLGVILYSMTTSCLPFSGKNLAELKNVVCHGRFVVPEHISPSLSRLLRNMLSLDPAKRASLWLFLDEPWLSEQGPATEWLIKFGLPPSMVQSRGQDLSTVAPLLLSVAPKAGDGMPRSASAIHVPRPAAGVTSHGARTGTPAAVFVVFATDSHNSKNKTNGNMYQR